MAITALIPQDGLTPSPPSAGRAGTGTHACFSLQRGRNPARSQNPHRRQRWLRKGGTQCNCAEAGDGLDHCTRKAHPARSCGRRVPSRGKDTAPWGRERGSDGKGKGLRGALRHHPKHRRGAESENGISPADFVKLNCKIINLITTRCLPSPCSWLPEEELANACGECRSPFTSSREV